MLEAEEISGDCIKHPERITVSTLQDLKGFEFKHVIVVGCGDRIFPLKVFIKMKNGAMLSGFT